MQSKCVCLFCHILMVSVPRGIVLLCKAVFFLIEAYLGCFSYFSSIVPWNCPCLIFVCHFLCLFMANSYSWNGWQPREKDLHWASGWCRAICSSGASMWERGGHEWERKRNRNITLTLKLFLLPRQFPRNCYQFKKKHELCSKYVKQS